MNKANRHALDGEYHEADKIYAILLEQYPDHPGILMNSAIGHLRGKDTDEGKRILSRSINSCSNYLPSLQLLKSLE